jgi:predicted ArsR family transcriptional regulator
MRFSLLCSFYAKKTGGVMGMASGYQRFFASRRGQIILLVRRGIRTVEELAQAMGMSDNGVRAHLDALMRDNLAVRSGLLRSGRGPPSFIYILTPEAERLFPKAYEPVLLHLLDVLGEQATPAQVEHIMREVGQRLAEQQPAPAGDLRARLTAALQSLNDLGGMAELEEQEQTFLIASQHCPLASVVPGHPEVCQMTETLLSALVGAPVQECCGRDGAARCGFEVAKAGAV